MLQRQIPIFIAFLGGGIMLLDYFFAYPVLAWLRENLTNWARIGFTFALFLGLVNLAQVNLKKVARQTAGWGYNLVLLLGVLATMGAGFIEGVKAGGVPGEGTVYRWFFDNIYLHCSATMFGLLAFFIASAAFRAFRAKNFEATLLLVTAIVVMLGNIPLGDIFARAVIPGLPWWLHPSYLQEKIMKIIVAAGQRAILMSAAIGLIVVSVKILTGVDRSYFGGE